MRSAGLLVMCLALSGCETPGGAVLAVGAMQVAGALMERDMERRQGDARERAALRSQERAAAALRREGRPWLAKVAELPEDECVGQVLRYGHRVGATKRDLWRICTRGT